MSGCWDCVFHKGAGQTLLGYCHYFEQVNRPPKEIPPRMVDLGCRFKKQGEPKQAELKGMEEQWQG